MAPLAKRTPVFCARRREVDDDALDVAHPVLLQAGEAVGDDLRETSGSRAAADRRWWRACGPRGRARRRAGRSGPRRRCGRPAASGRSPRRASAHGVVEVAGVDGVDGDDEVVGEVLAAVEVVFAERGGRVARFFQGVLGERIGQAVGADDRQRIDAGLAARPENLGDDALAAVLRRRESAPSRRRPCRPACAPLAPGSPT